MLGWIKRLFLEKSVQMEKVEWGQLEDWVKEKIEKNKGREEEVWGEIKSKISVFQEEIGVKVKELEGVDIEKKEVEERAKTIIKENLGNYVNSVKKLVEETKGYEEKGLREFREEVLDIFLNFDKKTFKNYQKAIFLVGKEIGEVRGCLMDFSGYLERVFKKNKGEYSEVLGGVVRGLKERKEMEEKKEEIGKKVGEIEKEELKLEKKVEEIKESKDYRENLERKERKREGKEEIKEKILELRELIDFKVLGNMFHTNEKEMELVKVYRENFQVAFQKDKEGILDLLKEAKLNNKKILDKVEEVEVKKEEVRDLEVLEEGIEEMLEEKKKLELLKEDLVKEKEEEIKRFEKIKKNREDSKDKIKEELKKIEVELIK